MIPKFRAWDKDTKLLLDVNTIDYKKSVAICEHWEFGETTELTFGDIILMQSTGLKDKHDVEIFEGDIVDFRVFNQAISGVYQIKRARSGEWRMDNSIQGRVLVFSFGDVEVIGNIYENPELMEEV